MAIYAAFSAIAILGAVVDATPTIAFPLNSQVPPVARISQLFQYTFSSSTFSSTLPMKYSLLNAPPWLSLDSNSRTLSGKPTPEDAGPDNVTGVEFGINAADDTGSVILNATIVISKDPPPIVNIPVQKQLSALGAVSLPSTALYYPSTPFKFSIDQQTFKAENGKSNFTYYAITADNTPLPSWIVFDQISFTFSGRTPDYASLIQPPQTFGIKLIASDVAGFAGASIFFDIKVGVHLFAFKNANLSVNFIPGVETKFDGLTENLQIDGLAANASLVTSITMNGPPWLSIDNSTLSLTGTPPSDAIAGNISVQATDVHGDTAIATVLFDVGSVIFTTEIGTLNATLGLSFSYDMSAYLRNKSDIDMTIELSQYTPWARFDSKNFLLSGDVPFDLEPFEDTLTVVAVSKSTQVSNNRTFALTFLPGKKNSQTTILLPLGTATTTNGSISNSPEGSMYPPHTKLSKATIAGITVAALSSVAFGLILYFFCRRRGHSKERDQETPKVRVSAPLMKEPVEVKVRNPTLAVPPATLHLDTSAFSSDNRSSVYTTEINRRNTKSNVDHALMRSRTYSGVSSISRPSCSHPERPSTTGGLESRTRAYSGSALSNSESKSNWNVGQDSSYPIIHSRTSSVQTSNEISTKRIARPYSNYSRKGYTRRSCRVWATNTPIRTSLISNPSHEETILNLKDDNFSAMPLANFTVMSKRTPISKIHEVASTSQLPNSLQNSRRNSILMSPLDQTRSGIGHGSRESIDSVMNSKPKRRSVGHGQNWTSIHGLPKDSRTWLTVDADETEVCTQSSSSNITEGTDILQTRNSIHLSPNPAQVSQQRHSRPISRRELGSTPFFSGRTESVISRKSPNSKVGVHLSAAQKEQATREMSTFNSTKSVANASQEPLFVTCMSTRESTKQLRTYVQSHLSRKSTGASIKSSLSRHARSRSASPSLQSVQQQQCDDEEDIEMRDCDDSYEDFVPDNCSRGSWETQNEGLQRDSQSTIYNQSSLPDVVEHGATSVQPSIQHRADKSIDYSKDSIIEGDTTARAKATRLTVASENSPLMGTAGNARVFSAREKRSASRERGKREIGIVKGKLESTESEQDYTAYI